MLGKIPGNLKIFQTRRVLAVAWSLQAYLQVLSSNRKSCERNQAAAKVLIVMENLHPTTVLTA
jgi:hypothetical protein